MANTPFHIGDTVLDTKYNKTFIFTAEHAKNADRYNNDNYDTERFIKVLASAEIEITKPASNTEEKSQPKGQAAQKAQKEKKCAQSKKQAAKAKAEPELKPEAKANTEQDEQSDPDEPSEQLDACTY